MLARDGLDGRQTRLDRFLPRGIRVERVRVMIEGAERLATRDRGFVDQPLRVAARRVVQRASGRSSACDRAECGRGAVAVVPQQDLQICEAPSASRPSDATATPLLLQLAGLAGLGIERIELGDVVRSRSSRASRSRARCSRSARALPRRATRATLHATAAASATEPAARVEQLALVGAPRQRLELQLTMDVDQQFAELAQRTAPASPGR